MTLPYSGTTALTPWGDVMDDCGLIHDNRRKGTAQLPLRQIGHSAGKPSEKRHRSIPDWCVSDTKIVGCGPLDHITAKWHVVIARNISRQAMVAQGPVPVTSATR